MPGIEAELEVKFTDIDLDVMRQKLLAIDAIIQTPERIMRRVVYGGEANPMLHCTYGRIRDEGDKVTMSAKYSAKDNEIASQKEAVVIVDDFDSATAILESFGLTVTNYQENSRETWVTKDGTLVELERWPHLPTYIEIEGSSIDSIMAAAAMLDLDWDKHTTDSTDKLYFTHYHGMDTDEARAMMADLRFDKNALGTTTE